MVSSHQTKNTNRDRDERPPGLRSTNVTSRRVKCAARASTLIKGHPVPEFVRQGQERCFMKSHRVCGKTQPRAAISSAKKVSKRFMRTALSNFHLGNPKRLYSSREPAFQNRLATTPHRARRRSRRKPSVGDDEA